ncbi:hypothetical protein CXB51_022017 [Gossypium anomalum]|uniref:RNase H type-1 domain-containing protein n=1 Tax=Gossypium anomalum TaxID=47600 RepID=A0A8J5Y5E5_9ROSI|nr:hypothetical protein CXB51_022017 [Gossypium anomalum]
MDHLFRDCPVSKAVWGSLSAVNFLQEKNLEFEQWLTRILVDQRTSLCRLFCCTLWAIWGDRNARIHDKTNRSGQEIACFVHSYLKEVDGLESTTSIVSKENTKWKHPLGQTVKINFDRAYNERNRQSASGIVVRNSEGFVLLSCTDIHHRVLSAFAAEALACRKATKIALNMQEKEIIIEGDSLSVIKKCKAKGEDKSQIGVYIHDIQQLQSKSSRVRFEYTPRSANGLAHTLATESLRRKEEMYMVEDVPTYAENWYCH